MLVITGLINAGKSTLAESLKKLGYKPVIEYTTRPMRENEKNGVDYHFVNDETFNKMDQVGEFGETLYVNTQFGLWKYGARKKDMKDGYVLVCGPWQAKQLLESGIPMFTVLLDIDRETAMERASVRGDNLKEVDRRYTKDEQAVKKIYNRMDMVLDSRNPVEDNVRAIGNRVPLIITAQEMTESEKHLCLDGDRGLKPYLRMREKGMPKNPVDQIAWLLLSGGGCGFCKVCRDKPCGIRDGESCTHNIAEYIRECVHKEDAESHQHDD